MLKITNYKEDEINSNDIKYKVTISNDTTSKLEVTKENELKDFMTNQKKDFMHVANTMLMILVYWLNVFIPQSFLTNRKRILL